MTSLRQRERTNIGQKELGVESLSRDSPETEHHVPAWRMSCSPSGILHANVRISNAIMSFLAMAGISLSVQFKIDIDKLWRFHLLYWPGIWKLSVSILYRRKTLQDVAALVSGRAETVLLESTAAPCWQG